MMPKAWYGTEEAPCCFFRSSIKFQDHMGCKIDDLNPIWVWISNYIHYKVWDEITFPSQHFIGVTFKLIHICKRSPLAHWGRDNMDAFSQMTLSNAFSWMKILELRPKIHWSLLRVLLTIYQHWFCWWLGADQATSHYLNQCWFDHWRIYASLGLNEFLCDFVKSQICEIVCWIFKSLDINSDRVLKESGLHSAVIMRNPLMSITLSLGTPLLIQLNVHHAMG